ncbi:MAG: ATP-binding protein [Smithellaceae bacterium]
MNKKHDPAASEQARLAEIEYHRRQNAPIALFSLPSVFLYAGFYFYLSHYFQFSLFALMSANIIIGLIIGHRLTNIEQLTVLKRVTTGITFGLLATNLLTGLWDPEIYYVVLPWILLYPLGAIIFFGRRPGFFTAIIFCILAMIFFVINDMPPLTEIPVQMFKFNVMVVLFTILLISLIYEKTRMKIQDELAISQNEYRLAEQRQRETNVELQQEIERRKLSEKALVESEMHYRALFEESTVALWEENWSQVKRYLDELPPDAQTDLALHFKSHPAALDDCLPLMRVKAVNRATLKLYGADSQSTLFRNLDRILSPDDEGFILKRILALYESGRYDAEVTGKTLQGKKLHLLVNSTLPAGYEASWEKVYSSVYDVTERVMMAESQKRVDQQLQNARQIQAIATLAGGIAHQFNNALAVIYGSLDLLEMQAQGNVESRRFLASLKTSASRMSRLTDQLLAYAEGGKYLPQEFSINSLVDDVVNSKISMRDSSITLNTRLDDHAPMISGDITQIKMVLEAVLSNSFEALNQGGEVTITTGHQMIDVSPDGLEAKMEPGLYAIVRVEDNGVGMKEEIIQRIFEPFFTTKIHGRGLGMAAAFGIVRNHDGMITVESEPGRGSRVLIYLPGVETQKKSMNSM